MLPPDWRARMTEVVRGAVEPDASWFGGGPILTPRQQVEVYREQFRLRLVDALTEDLPGFVHLAGDRAEGILWDYLRDCPPDSWTLNRAADRFADWLTGVPEAWVEMARLDLAITQGFEAADGTAIGLGDLSPGARFRLRPPVRLLRPRHAVHRLRSAVVNDRPPPALDEGDFPLVLFRKGLRMRHVELDDGAWRLLAALGSGATLEEAVEAVADVPDLALHLGPWCRRIAELPLLQPG